MIKAQWLDRDRLRALQASKLRRLVRHAYESVPYYRGLMDDAGVTPADVDGPEDLIRIPVTTKADLRSVPPDALISSRANRRKLRHETSSGSAGAPFTVRYDSAFQHVRNAQFLRALGTAGYRAGRRTLMVTARARDSSLKRLLGWRYASIEDPPQRLLESLRAVKPVILYGCLTPLRLLAEEISRSVPQGWPLQAVIITAETLDSQTRRLFERTFRCSVFDFYGLTEMGLVGWECAEHRGYHLSEDTVLVEQTPSSIGGESRLIMTNLESMAMPFIRFDSGDIGVAGDERPCPCGRTFALLDRIEGRVMDSVRLEDGRSITPYALTCRLERVPGVRRFQVVQEDIGAFTVRVVTEDDDHAASSRGIRSALCSVLGPGIRVNVRQETRIDPPPGVKFRVVESLMGGAD
jgi:phenylacetate-CoA ligase